MSKVFITFCIFLVPLFGAISWESEHIFHLKKDEVGTVYFYEIGKNRKKYTYVFNFKWTLHDGKKVTVLSNYREFPRQHTLYFKSRLNTLSQVLLNNLNAHDDKKTYLVLQMEKYDKKTKEISFMVFVKDANQRLEIKYMDPKRKR